MINAETSDLPLAYQMLMTRRSVRTRDMVGPGPDDEALTAILAAALRVPDHGKLAPWRYLVLRGDEREKLGRVISDALIAEQESSPLIAEKMARFATQAPVLIVAIFSPHKTDRIPLVEQTLSMGAACQNILMATHALGFAGQWLTGWPSFSPAVAQGLGLGGHEQIAGMIFLGSKAEDPDDRPRPDPARHILWHFPEMTGMPEKTDIDDG